MTERTVWKRPSVLIGATLAVALPTSSRVLVGATLAVALPPLAALPLITLPTLALPLITLQASPYWREQCHDRA